MAARVGYRALIVDSDVLSHRLSQFLLRPELNNRIIQGIAFADTLSDAYYQAEQADFIYIDPFYFGLPESIRFIAEVQSHWPVKSFTLFRSSHTWQERQRDLDNMVIGPAKLRTMLSLDKDTMGDATFSQMVRNNIASMEREIQQELQRSGFSQESIASRSGVYGPADYPPGYRQQGVLDIGIAGVNLGPNASQAQLQQIVEAVVGALTRQPVTQTHPLMTMLPSPEIAQWGQAIPQLQQAVPQLQQTVLTLQQTLTKTQEQLTALQREQRDLVRATSGADQRVHDVETRQTKLEQLSASLTSSQRMSQIFAIIALVLGLLALIAVPVVLLSRH